jgi:hypothetical protein
MRRWPPADGNHLSRFRSMNISPVADGVAKALVVRIKKEQERRRLRFHAAALDDTTAARSDGSGPRIR